MIPLLSKLKQIFILSVVVLFCIGCTQMGAIASNPWKPINLDTESTLADLDFTSDLQHGWLVGTQETIFESKDGGLNWEQKQIDLGDEKASFTAVSFNGEEGWITGRPSILLHTNDGGDSWARIPLSNRLPGAPYGIKALDQGVAEMVTDLGAIYKTSDGGKTWKALVEGAVGVARTIERSPEGEYIAVSARGNFYSTWKPGDSEWTPHNRNSSRRLQSMGFGQDNRQWLLARGGLVQFSDVENPEDKEAWTDPVFPQSRNSLGLLHIGYRTPDELWAAGGSGSLMQSTDGGQTWLNDAEVADLPTNFYKVIFLTPEKGFVLGQQGVILRYDTSTEAA